MLIHHIHGPLCGVGLGRCLAGQAGVGSLGVVEGDPVANDPFGLKAVGQVVQVRQPLPGWPSHV